MLKDLIPTRHQKYSELLHTICVFIDCIFVDRVISNKQFHKRRNQHPGEDYDKMKNCATELDEHPTSLEYPVCFNHGRIIS
jgi:hypothetical protein